MGNQNNVKIGDIIEFGRYPFDADGTVRPITWKVLDRKGETALIVTEYAIDTKPYHERREDVTWENCSLRYWLNHDFLDVAFTDIENSAILLTEVDNSDTECYDKYLASGGNNTKDKVFLLSYREVFNKYFQSYESRTCFSTTHASKKTYTKKGHCWWWLRSPGRRQNHAALINNDGWIDYYYVNDSTDCVRPALWVDLKILYTMRER